MEELRYDIWLRDPYRWDLEEDGPYVGYSLFCANQPIKEVIGTLLHEHFSDVAIVEAGSEPFVKGEDGNLELSKDLYMIAHCLQPLTGFTDPKTFNDFFKQQDE